MFLETWMIAVVALTFGVCAWWNRSRGFTEGAKDVLQHLHDNNIIMIEDGHVVPYRNAWAPRPQKRRRVKKAVDI